MIKNHKNVQIEINGRKFFCPVEVTMSMIGGKWSTPILWYLRNRTLRYGELKKLLVNISEKVLINELKSLEKRGLIIRTVYNQVPLRLSISYRPMERRFFQSLT